MLQNDFRKIELVDFGVLKFRKKYPRWEIYEVWGKVSFNSKWTSVIGAEVPTMHICTIPTCIHLPACHVVVLVQ